jgi:RecB family exonuclease
VPHAPTVEIHHDFAVLERRLATLLAGLNRDHGPFAPGAVIAPTRRLVAHLQETLAAAMPALLNVRFLHHDALAAAIADDATLPPLRPLGDGARVAILADLVARGGGPPAAYAAAVPGSVAALLATLDELREAGVPAAAGGIVPGLSAAARALMELYAGYCATLDRLIAAGYADRAGRIAAVLDHAPRFAARYRLIIHYGAYELVGMNLDLMRAVHAAGVPVIYLAPGHATAPAFAYSRDFWREMLAVEPVTVPGSDDPGRLIAGALPLLYDEEARGTLQESVAFHHTQGAAAELAEAALIAIDDHRRHGGPAHRIAILARTMEPYAAALQPIVRANTLPVTTSAALPLLRETSAQAALRLLRCVLLDFPAQAFFDLLRGGLLRPAAGGDPAIDVDAWERLAREYQIHGGRRVFVDLLPSWIESSAPRIPDDAGPEVRERAAGRRRALLSQARHLKTLVAALDRDGARLRAARDWRAWAGAARRLVQERLAGFTPGGADAGTASAEAILVNAPADTVLVTLDDLEAIAAAGVRFDDPTAALVRFEQAVAAASLPLGALRSDGEPDAGDNGGVRVLDVMQARGLAFDTVILVGLNATLFPRPPRPDPFLPDADRLRLRATLHRPVPIKEVRLDEEHLLLALALGSARRRLAVSWQRADEAGKARAPSLALREIARVTRGSPDLDLVVSAARRVSADPLSRGRESIAAHGLLAPADAGLAVALAARSPERLRVHVPFLAPRVLAGPPEALDSGLRFLLAIASRDRSDFDALVGPGWERPSEAAPGAAPPGPAAAMPSPRTWSPSRLETLGACPQQFFFRHVLGVEEWGDPSTPHELDRREIGEAVHSVLAEVYRDIGEVRTGSMSADIGQRLRGAWDRHTGRVGARLEALYPGLWGLVGGQWLEALGRFLARDLPALRARGGTVECEKPVTAALILPGDLARLGLHGRFDRLLRNDNEVVVADYKTGGKPEDHVDLANILKGRRLQMALYALMAEAGNSGEEGERATARAASATAPGTPGPRVEVEVLGVGPEFEPDPDAARARLDMEKFNRARAGIFETLEVLEHLAAGGLFPLNEGSERCEWCHFRRACRRSHPATLERLAARPELLDYIQLRRKNTRRPFLADVESAGGQES